MKTEYVGLRLTENDLAAVDAICELEERSRSYCVRFFVRWGIAHYHEQGSFLALQAKKSAGNTKARKANKRQAKARLKLLREAETHEHEDDFRSIQAKAG